MSRVATAGMIAFALLVGACAAAAEQEAPDPAHFSFVDNLLAKEEAGEWTRGEGLVATLRMFVGEVEEAEVLRHEDVDEREGAGIIMMAHEYLTNGPDDQLKAEIERLLEPLVFSREQLERMAGLTPDTASAQPALASLGDMAVTTPASASLEKDCALLFQGAAPFAGISACLEYNSVSISGKTYRVFYPASSWPDAGWNEYHYATALDAMIHTVPKFLELGDVPPVDLLFSASTKSSLNAQAYPLPGHCIVTMYIPMADQDAWPLNDFAQVVAHELAHCFQVQNYYDQTWVPAMPTPSGGSKATPSTWPTLPALPTTSSGAGASSPCAQPSCTRRSSTAPTRTSCSSNTWPTRSATRAYWG